MAPSQCVILYINSSASDCTQTRALRSLGFRVVETGDIPEGDTMEGYHAVVLRAKSDCPLPSVATRFRARPGFGRRVLIALVAASVSLRAKHDAVDSGFDLVLPEDCSARDLAAAILGLLRRFPEYRCLLRSITGRRRAA
ncbi:MAG TPA: hypothetical protein VEL79_08045 [Vicinamibacterales bacterium]|nr:hypothetical protein [Vicinamibacterales bacterium]